MVKSVHRRVKEIDNLVGIEWAKGRCRGSRREELLEQWEAIKGN